VGIFCGGAGGINGHRDCSIWATPAELFSALMFIWNFSKNKISKPAKRHSTGLLKL